jgi:serine/threonine-protein kinase
VGESSRYCASCGTNLDLPDSPTGTAPRPSSRPSRSATASPTSASGLASGKTSDRFAPGTVLGERYRILGLLGRGGMGEVYRADDLKLEQPVALKFLPAGLEEDPERLERLFGEVRMARQVSHPAVCRVWDIGEADGQHFLSMEFVDGENLSSLLRRIGRLPVHKALDIARQVGAGLAAAHEKGVLHRDLKPANVMLDGQGNVRITDFGLAGLAEVLSDEDVRSGTPAFMSPEQLLGREVTARSDIYSLGLLLYELFTGRRAFGGRTLAELTRQHRDERPVDPSAIVPDLAPAIESTILACLEMNPARRPPSALAVSGMLGGQDPLEAAIAAGITPSPELVAAAGEAERFPQSMAWVDLACILLAVFLAPLLLRPSSLVNLVPVEKSPEVLEDRARELITKLGFEATPADTAVGFRPDAEYFRHARQGEDPPRDWETLQSGHPPVLRFWYWQGPRPLVSQWMSGTVTWSAPPPTLSEMAGVVYDMRGHLLEFYAVPPQIESDGAGGREPDWAPLFAEARLDPTELEPATPSWLPPFFADTRAAWTGSWSRRSDIPIRVEAAAYRGQPVSFRIIQPWTRPERMERLGPSRQERAAMHFMLVLLILLIAVGAVLARRNLIIGRGDRRGAFRLAAGLVGVGLMSWALEAHHVADFGGEFQLIARGAGMVVLMSSLLWLFYLALEPYVRRLRPTTLVSWTRFLGGGLGDTVVGRDVLIGAAWGALVTFFLAACHRVPAWLGHPAEAPSFAWLPTLLGPGVVAARVLDVLMSGILLGLGSLLLYLILRFVLRRELPTMIGFVGVLTVLVAAGSEPVWLGASVGLIVMGSYAVLLTRVGLLAACAGTFFANCLMGFHFTTDLGSWMAGPTLLVLPLLALVAVLAFRSALGGSGLRRYLVGETPPSRP